MRRAGYLLLLLLLLLLLFVYHDTAMGTLTFPTIKANCSSTKYTANSPFSTNLNSLFSTFKANSSSSLAINQTSGEYPDAVFGLFFCTGDLSSDDCQSCIQTAIKDITENSCPSSRRGIIWNNYCELRYSDTNFFGLPDTNGFNMTNPNEKTSSTRPVEVVSQLVKEAPLEHPLMFKSQALANESLYALAQCSTDLNTASCSDCLTTILTNIKDCCTGANGWRYLAPSCWIRYEATPFLQNLNGVPTQIMKSNCEGDNFTSNGVNATQNIASLLTSLTEKAPTMAGFYNTSAGEGINKLYGLALCRAYLQSEANECQSCLKEASKSLLENCPDKTQAIEWYEKCLIRYSNRSFFGVVDNGLQPFCGVETMSADASSATVKLASSLINDAVNNEMFVGAGNQVTNNSLTSYVLVQCTRDLTKDGCMQCLRTGLNSVSSQCNSTNGWRYLSGSCTLRFEVNNPFFDTALISTQPSPISPPPITTSNSVSVVAIVAPVLGVILLGSCICYIWWLRRRNEKRRKQIDEYRRPLTSDELPFMDLATIQAATGNFAVENKLGEGGFGPVYKGVLKNGTEIAVKRLKEKSTQGATEFENEVKLIAKLQQGNLVKMLGWCVERGEKLLIYEYVPNKSLDGHLFDSEKRAQLDWNRRLQIIGGIARGLLYLHEDSVLKVIHRDLKASNVLLDNKMTPKISDFGMARIFGGDESEANTNRVVGTYGYMAPEFAMGGLFSAKSDVYSFGVLFLEIITGQRNGREHFEEHGVTLIRNMWHLWVEGKALELIDPLLGDSCPMDEAKKCIKIGLLCVQENAEERPTMSLVVHMLRSSDDTMFPEPSQPPTFMTQRTMVSDESTASSIRSHATSAHSINDVTNSDVQAR